MTAQYPDLAGKTVFISGGATGIGLDLVTVFHGQNADVVFCDINEAAGEALRDDLGKTGPTPMFLSCDVTDTPALRDALQTAEAQGDGLAVLVNNAAKDTRRPTGEFTEADWSDAVDVNLRHQFFAAQAAVKWMAGQRRGSIINFGSVAPEMMVENLAVYSACKAGVRGLTRSLARDFGGKGVRVNTILPGAILTPRQRESWFPDQARIDAVVAQQCLKLELTGAHVAAMALFLASDASAACTAQDFIVDGGMV
jgi:NAD(P)-dependent dehydrogenase (short-subunit alcohol dehydrogenase family)